MASKDHSFDVVSEVNFQEVSNAVDQARKEITTRFDFKDSKTSIDWNLTEKTVTIGTDNDYRLKAVTDVLQTKFAKRGVSLRSLETGSVEKAAGGTVRQVITIRKGIPSEKAKEIVRFVKDARLKVQAQIQEDQVRILASKIDDLQDIIRLLRNQNFGLDLQFINYR